MSETKSNYFEGTEKIDNSIDNEELEEKYYLILDCLNTIIYSR